MIEGNLLKTNSIRTKYVRLNVILLVIIIIFTTVFTLYLTRTQDGLSQKLNKIMEKMGIQDHASNELNQVFLQMIAQEDRYMFILFGFSALILLVFIVLMWRSLKDIISPITALSNATEALIQGRDVKLLSFNRNDEIGQLSASFNHMVRSIQDHEEELIAQNEELTMQQEELTMQQEELRSNQERLQHSLTEIESMTKALDQSAAVAIMDEHGVFNYVNDNLCEWTQLKADQFLGRSYHILFSTNSSACDELEKIPMITNAGGIWSGDIQFTKKDGTSLWLQSTLVPYVNSRGIVYKYILIANDFSQVKQAETKLVESLAQTEKTKETLERHNQLNHALTYSLDKQEFTDSFLYHINELYPLDSSLFYLIEDKVIASNRVGPETVTHFIDDDLENMYFRLSEEKSFVIKREADAPERGIAHESTVFCYDLYSGIFNAHDEIIALFCATRIGHPFHSEEIIEMNGLMKRVSLALERIIMFDEIEEARKLTQDIINNVNEGIQFVDPNGRMIQSNKALCRIVDCDHFVVKDPIEKELWISQFVRSSLDGENLQQFFKKALENTSITDYSMRYAVDGEVTRYMEVYATSIFQQDEKIGTIFVHRDMTKEHEVDQMKSELVSTVSHELRTPLSSVLGFAELLLSKNLKPERQQKYVETIHKEAKRLTNLINDFLDLQRMETGNQQYKLENCALDKLVMEMIDRYKHEKRHQVIFLDEAKGTWVKADKERLIQVFTNMMSNAVKFSPEGGRITVRLSNDNDHVIMSIQDEGIGIPRDELPKLFQKFKRIDNSASRNVGGTGLGLAICKEIITSFNGSVWIESEEGVGTTIFCSLPLLNQPIIDTVFEESNTRIENHANIMIVEDDSSLALLLSEELKMKGFRVIHHYNPRYAFEDALKIPLVGVVIDLMLGDDMDGWDLIRELKSNASTMDVPIVVSSALDKSEEKIQKYSIEKYLTKPYPSRDLTNVIMELFSRIPNRGEITFPED